MSLVSLESCQGIPVQNHFGYAKFVGQTCMSQNGIHYCVSVEELRAVFDFVGVYFNPFLVFNYVILC